MEFLTWILNSLDRVPATFWGVVVGSFFSIAGVRATNRASFLRLRAQFDHEQQLKTKEREMSFRKDIYLALAESVHAGIQDLHRFSNLDITHVEVTAAFNEKSPAMAKVHVIAKTETVTALANFSSELNAAFYYLFARRFELFQTKYSLSIVDDQIARSEKERDKYLSLMQQFNLNKEIDQQRWDVVTTGFEMEVKRVNEALVKREQLVVKLQKEQAELMKECTSAAEKVSKLVIPLLATVRGELELPLDFAKYEDLLQQSAAKQAEAMNRFIQHAMPASTGQGKA